MTKIDALKWIAFRAEYARDFAGEDIRKEIVAEIARVAIEALNQAKRRAMVNHPNRSLRAKLKRDGDRYIVSNGLGDRLGFVRQYPHGRWSAVDTYMEKSRDFPTRTAAIEWLDNLPFEEDGG